MKLQSLIKALKLDYINDDLTDEHFPYNGEPLGDVVLFHPNEYISTEAVLERMEKEELRPATIHEMLVWAKENWKGEDVTALGSVWAVRGGYRGVACLGRGGSGRGLRLGWLGGVWFVRSRFAAVKVSMPLDTRTLSTAGLLERVEALEKKMEKIDKLLTE